MGMDMTVARAVRSHIGDDENAYEGIPEASAPFRFSFHTIPFDCPRVDPDGFGILIFESFQVDFSTNLVSINGYRLNLRRKLAWGVNTILIPPGFLNSINNFVHFQSRDENGKSSGVPSHGDLDDFVIDNVVVLYKTVSE